MSVTPVDVAYLSVIASEFSSESESRVSAIYDIVTPFASENVFKESTRYARALLVAHTLKVDQLKGGGKVTSERVGDLSRNYGSTGTEDELDLTSYGTEFKRIRKAKVVPLRFIGS